MQTSALSAVTLLSASGKIWLSQQLSPFELLIRAVTMSKPKTCVSSCSCSAKPSDAVIVDTDITPKVNGPLVHSVFRIPAMDCPSEEHMIRLRLADAPVASLDFNLPGRTLVIQHIGDAADILQCVAPLGYGAELQESRLLQPDEAVIMPLDDAAEARVLWILLGINAVMFAIEIINVGKPQAQPGDSQGFDL